MDRKKKARLESEESAEVPAAALPKANGGEQTMEDGVATVLNAKGEGLGVPPAPGQGVEDFVALSAVFNHNVSPFSNQQPGNQIGPFKLLQLVGEGGFGSVWLAEQREPLRRRVALKLIKFGMDSKQVLARFDAERQALAMMDHPNIAKVLDAGTTDTGRPYFVMEYVAGIPILKYSDQEKLDTKARLELFVQVCHAIQHAHQKGIIHRDIKPSNLLVAMQDGVPVPKVIDFGIAKATSGALTTMTLVTEHRQMIGTPAYMSPEQAEMSTLDIDTRSDIYSLGVVLYEMLTGTKPFDVYDLMQKGSGEMLRILREVEPRRPSTRVSTREEGSAEAAERRRSATPEQLSLLLRGDLDWIVMKCLEKDRTRRYETSNALALDIQRHLANLPVTARPPSAGYKLQKFVKRHRAPVMAAGAIVVLLVLGIVGATGGRIWADKETTRANEAKEKAKRAWASESAAKRDALENETKAVAALELAKNRRAQEADARRRAETIRAFVTTALRASDAGGKGKTKDTTILEAMDRAVADIASGRFQDDPEMEASLKNTIGIILSNNGRGAQAELLLTEALAIRRRLYLGDDLSLVVSLNNLAHVLAANDRAVDAEPLYVQAFAMNRRLHATDDLELAKSIGNLGFVRQALGRNEAAEDLLVEALEMHGRLGSGDHPIVALVLDNLGKARLGLGRTEEAETLFTRALAMRRRLYESDHPDLARGLGSLGHLLWSTRRFAEAEPLFVEASEMLQRIFKGDDPSVLLSLSNLATVRLDLGRPAEAEPLFTHALEMSQRLFPGDHASVAQAMINLARARRALGRFAEAEPLFVQALEMRQRILPADAPEILDSMGGVAAIYSSLGRPEEAAVLLEDLLEVQEDRFGRRHPNTLRNIGNLGAVYLAQGRLKEAVPLLEEAYRAATEHPMLAAFGAPLLEAYVKAADPARPEDAARVVALIQERLDAFAKTFDRRQPRDVATGVAMTREFRAAARAVLPAGSPELAQQLASSGLILLALGACAEAETPLREALAIRKKTLPEHWSTFNTQSMLGGALLGQKRFADAEPLLIDAYRGMKDREKSIPPQGATRISEALERLVQLYEATGKATEATAWRKVLDDTRGPESKRSTDGAQR